MSHARLTTTQIKNPKLPKTDLVRAKPAPFWDTVGLTVCALFASFCVTLCTMLVLDAAFINGVGLAGDNAMNGKLAFGAIFIGTGLSSVSWFMARYGLPKMLPPLEFKSQEHRAAYEEYHALSDVDQREANSAYRAYMNTAASYYGGEPYRLWRDTHYLILERKRLLNVTEPEPEDPFLEDARHVLASLKEEVEQIKELS